MRATFSFFSYRSGIFSELYIGTWRSLHTDYIFLYTMCVVFLSFFYAFSSLISRASSGCFFDSVFSPRCDARWLGDGEYPRRGTVSVDDICSADPRCADAPDPHTDTGALGVPAQCSVCAPRVLVSPWVLGNGIWYGAFVLTRYVARSFIFGSIYREKINHD